MATDVERLIVSLEASITKYDRAMARALGTANKTAKGIETRFAKMNASLGANVGRLLVAGFSAAAVQKFLDAGVRIENSLKVAGLAGDELTKVYDRLFQSAQKNAAPLESLVELYSRASLVQNELGISSEELLNFTDKVAVALRVAGKSASESSGALLQLSQALGSGVVRAEEFNSILEGALPIAQAAAVGLKEAGGSVATLRKLVIEGKVSSEAFFRAFEAGAVTLEQRVARSALTSGQAFVTLQNSLIAALGKFDSATGASAGLVREIQTLARWIEYLGDRFEDLAGPLQTVAEWVEFVRNKFKDLREVTGIESFFEGTALLEGKIGFANPVTKSLEERAKAVDALRESLERLQEQSVGTTVAPEKKILDRFNTAFGVATPDPVSLADFAPPASAKTGRTREGDLQRETRQIQEQTAALQLQLTLIGQTEFARDRANALLELENAAKKEGIALDQDKREELELLAEGYAKAAEAVRQVEDRQAAVNELQQQFGEMAIDGIFDLIEGSKSLNDVLADTLKVLAKMALQAALLGQGPLASLFGTASTTGGTGGIIGALFGGARAGGGPVQKGRAYVVGEKRPELFIPQSNGMIIPKVPSGGIGGMTFSYSTVIDARGSEISEARFRQVIAESEARVKQSIIPIVRDAQSRRAIQ
jgi:tape measure domain-containing protein